MLTYINVLLFPKIKIQYQDSGKHLVALDGLRGIAIVLVMLFHMFHFMFGWCGVDLFFVLSGFLITGVLLDNTNSKSYLKDFWIKRILRIFPLYYLVLAVIIIPKVFFGINTVSYTSWTYWFYLHNWQYVANGVFPDGIATLNHFWSLAIEEQFYLFFPLVIKYLPKKTIPIVLIGFILLAIGFRFYYFNNDNIGYYVATFSRMDSIAIGALIAYGVRYFRPVLEKLTLPTFYASALYLLTVFLVTQDPHFSNPYFGKFGLTVFALFFGSILIFCISDLQIETFRRAVEHKYLIYFGKISYGLYVYHWIFYVFIKHPLEGLVFGVLQHVILAKVITSLTIVAITVLVGTLSFKYFEKPFLNLKSQLIAKPFKH